MFTLSICWTTFNLPWFMDLTFQVPMQYRSLEHQTLLPSPVTSTTGSCFCLGSVSSFFLELFLHSSTVACLAPSDLGSAPFSVLSFCLFILFMRFSRQEYWSGLPFPSPVAHILSELSTMTRPSWVVLHGMAYSFIELDKSMWLDWLVFCDCGFQFVCPLMEKDERLMEAFWWDRLTEGKLGVVLMGGAMLSKSLICWWVWLCSSLLFTWGQTLVELMKIIMFSFKRSPACTATLSAPNPAAGHHRHTPPLDTPGHSQASLGQSLVRSLFLSLESWCT